MAATSRFSGRKSMHGKSHTELFTLLLCSEGKWVTVRKVISYNKAEKQHEIMGHSHRLLTKVCRPGTVRRNVILFLSEASDNKILSM